MQVNNETTGKDNMTGKDVKLYLPTGDVRRFSLADGSQGYTQTLSFLNQVCPHIGARMQRGAFALTYVDDEQETITISSDTEFSYYLLNLPLFQPNSALIRLTVAKRQKMIDRERARSARIMARTGSKVGLKFGTPKYFQKTVVCPGDTVFLVSKSSERTLRISQNGEVSGSGGQGRWATFKVRKGAILGSIKLQNVGNEKNFLRITKDLQVDGCGRGGKWTDFEVVYHDKLGELSLRSVMHGKGHVGVLPNGTMKDPKLTGTGLHGRFVVYCLNTSN